MGSRSATRQRALWGLLAPWAGLNEMEVGRSPGLGDIEPIGCLIGIDGLQSRQETLRALADAEALAWRHE